MANFKAITGSAAIGNDPKELNDFAAHLVNNSIPALNDLLTAVDNKMGQTTWVGADATNFSGEWEKAKSQIKTTMTELLQGTADKAKAQAQAQTDVSAV